MLRTLRLALEALTGAAEGLHRAALILRQEGQPGDQRKRSPDDLRRIAGQFSTRAQACQQALESVLATGRSIVGPAPGANTSTLTQARGSAS